VKTRKNAQRKNVTKKNVPTSKDSMDLDLDVMGKWDSLQCGECGECHHVDLTNTKNVNVNAVK
jgi:hypothetical protein